MGLQLVLDHTDAAPSEEALVNLADHVRLFRDDAGLAVLAFFVTAEMLILDDNLTLLHSLPFSPDDIAGHGLALRLRRFNHKLDHIDKVSAFSCGGGDELAELFPVDYDPFNVRSRDQWVLFI